MVMAMAMDGVGDADGDGGDGNGEDGDDDSCLTKLALQIRSYVPGDNVHFPSHKGCHSPFTWIVEGQQATLLEVEEMSMAVYLRNLS